jgi:protein-S-isoprenylcysteine O-methyltransferase Ste14
MLLVAGLGLAAWAIRDLGDNLTAFPKPRRQGMLVRRGLYARARHPIYGGLIVAALGWALWKASALHLLLAAILAVYMTAKSRVEERFLESRFPEYAGYRARTRRLLPWIL